MRALVLSGGGSKGAFQAGTIKFLTEQGLSWNIIAGVSVGALNGAFLSQYSPSEHSLGANDLLSLWNDLKGNESVYRKHTLGIVGRLASGGYYSSKPLEDLVREKIDHTKILNSGVILHIGAISCTSGEYRSVTQTVEDLYSWIMASSAFPVAFPPVHIDGDTWTDGGIGKYSPLTDIISYKEELLEIDFISTEPVMALSVEDLPKHIKLNVYSPNKALSVKSLNFSPKKIKEHIALGYENTKSHFEKINKTS